MADQVSDVVRNMILTGTLKPNQRITHDELATLLGVSTMPVREALLRLSHDGLIKAKPNRSFRVAASSRADLLDLYWIASILAGELTARSCERVGPELVSELRPIQDEWRLLRSPESDVALEELNRQFHQIVNQAAASPRLLLFLRNALRLIPDHLFTLLPGFAETSLRYHQEIIDAMERRASSAARASAAAHIHETGQLLVRYFDDIGYWNAPAAVDQTS